MLPKQEVLRSSLGIRGYFLCSNQACDSQAILQETCKVDDTDDAGRVTGWCAQCMLGAVKPSSNTTTQLIVFCRPLQPPLGGQNVVGVNLPARGWYDARITLPVSGPVFLVRFGVKTGRSAMRRMGVTVQERSSVGLLLLYLFHDCVCFCRGRSCRRTSM